MDPLAAFDPIAKLKARFDPRAQRPIVLEIDLNHGLLSAAPDHPVAAWKARSAPAMKAVRDALRAGVDDDRVSGLVVHVGNCPLDTAQIDELGIELRRFGDRKPVIAWTESFGELTNALLGYRLASYADEIWMQPSGSLGDQRRPSGDHPAARRPGQARGGDPRSSPSARSTSPPGGSSSPRTR